MSRRGVEVELGLHPALEEAVEHAGHDAFVQRLDASLLEYAGQLGIAQPPWAQVTGGSDRAITIRAGRTTLPYPPSFLVRLWFGIAPADLRSAPDGYLANGRFPDSWLIRCTERVAASRDIEGCAAVSELAAQLMLEVIALRPSALLTVDEAAATMTAGTHTTPLEPLQARDLLANLLDLGVALPDPEWIRRTVTEVRRTRRSPEDTFEEAFALRRADRPEIEISANLFSLVADGSDGDRVALAADRVAPEARQAVEAAYGETVQKLGLRPWLEFVRNDSFERPEMRVKLNDRTSPPIPLPGPDEVAVTARPAQLRAVGVDARPLVDAVTGREQSAVASAASEQLTASRFVPVPVISYVAAAFGRAATPNAYRMLSIAEVERDLALIEARFPVLVHAALARFTLGQITRLLRALAREQVSIRNLRRILGILLAYDASNEEDLERLFLDDRLPGPEVRVGPPWARSLDARLLSFVRARMRDRVCYDSGVRIDGSSPAQVHETDDALEQLIDGILVSQTREEAEQPLHRLRVSVWHALADDAERRPILLTATRVRLGLRRAIEAELPAIPVLARTEIVAGANLQFLGPVTPVL